MSKMSDLHASTASDRADDAEREVARLAEINAQLVAACRGLIEVVDPTCHGARRAILDAIKAILEAGDGQDDHQVRHQIRLLTPTREELTAIRANWNPPTSFGDEG